MCEKRDCNPTNPNFQDGVYYLSNNEEGGGGVNNKKKFKFRTAIGTFNQIKQRRNIRAKEEEKNKRRKLISKAIQIFP